MGVFQKYAPRQYPYRYGGRFEMVTIAGGVPLDPDVLYRHLTTKVALDTPADQVRAEVTEIMATHGLTLEEAIEAAAELKGLVGFHKDADGQLTYPAANFKAGLVEAANVAGSAGRLPLRKWGLTGKGLLGWMREHVFIEEHVLGLGVTEPTEVRQSFIHKVLPGRGPISAIQYTQVCHNVGVDFTLETDFFFPEEMWAAIWLTAEHTGFGASRKRGDGVGELVRFEPLSEAAINEDASLSVNVPLQFH